MTIIHHYTDDAHDESATLARPPAALRGCGTHPSAQLLARHGWHYVADRPTQPLGTHWVPDGHALVDGVSVPQGAWVPDEPPDTVERDDCIASIRAVFASLEIDPIPAGWPEAIAAVKSLPSSLAQVSAAVELLALHSLLTDLGGTWEMVADWSVTQ